VADPDVSAAGFLNRNFLGCLRHRLLTLAERLVHAISRSHCRSGSGLGRWSHCRRSGIRESTHQRLPARAQYGLPENKMLGFALAARPDGSWRVFLKRDPTLEDQGWVALSRARLNLTRSARGSSIRHDFWPPNPLKPSPILLEVAAFGLFTWFGWHEAGVQSSICADSKRKHP
jgi:hypothetical protein